MAKYTPYSGSLIFCVKTQGGKELSTHKTFKAAKESAINYTNKTKGRSTEIWRYYGRIE